MAWAVPRADPAPAILLQTPNNPSGATGFAPEFNPASRAWPRRSAIRAGVVQVAACPPLTSGSGCFPAGGIQPRALKITCFAFSAPHKIGHAPSVCSLGARRNSGGRKTRWPPPGGPSDVSGFPTNLRPSLVGTGAFKCGVGSPVMLSPFCRGGRVRFPSGQKEPSFLPAPEEGFGGGKVVAGRGLAACRLGTRWHWLPWAKKCGGCLCLASSCPQHEGSQGWGTRGRVLASHRCCERRTCPVMSFPAAAAQGVVVGSHPELSAQFFLCSSSDKL